MPPTNGLQQRCHETLQVPTKVFGVAVLARRLHERETKKGKVAIKMQFHVFSTLAHILPVACVTVSRGGMRRCINAMWIVTYLTCSLLVTVRNCATLFIMISRKNHKCWRREEWGEGGVGGREEWGEGGVGGSNQ